MDQAERDQIECLLPLTIREQGDANHYALIDARKKWLVNMLVNGEHLTEWQKAILEYMVTATNSHAKLVEVVKEFILCGPNVGHNQELIGKAWEALEVAGHRDMKNLSMKASLLSGVMIDVSQYRVDGTPGVYLLPRFVEGKDYADCELERWIFSIGRDLITGQIWAATDARFYGDSKFECVFLR